MSFLEPRLAGKQSRAAIGLVARGLMALLFTFYVNYIPFHLLTERHLDDAMSPAQAAAIHFDHDDDADHDSDGGHHNPHPSSEHALQILTKSESLARCIVLFPAVTAVVFDAPRSFVAAALVERIWPPGESPPDPAQPRAPPST